MKQSLTFRYSLHQMAYWAAAAGVVSFASAFLLEKGFAASWVRGHISDDQLLKLPGLFSLLKALLFLQASSVGTVLTAGVGMAAAGAAILLLTVDKKDT